MDTKMKVWEMDIGLHEYTLNPFFRKYAHSPLSKQRLIKEITLKVQGECFVTI